MYMMQCRMVNLQEVDILAIMAVVLVQQGIALLMVPMCPSFIS